MGKKATPLVTAVLPPDQVYVFAPLAFNKTVELGQAPFVAEAVFATVRIGTLLLTCTFNEAEEMQFAELVAVTE